MLQTIIVQLVRHRGSVAVLAAGLWFLINAVIGLTAIGNQVHHRLTRDTNLAVRGFDRILGQARDVFAELNGQGVTTCSDDLILDMRRLVFRYDGIQDVLYFAGDDLVPTCSASLGRIENAQPLPKPRQTPNLKSALQYWLSLPVSLFGGDVKSFVVKDGHFAVTADMSSAFNPALDATWEIYTIDDDGRYRMHISGQEGLYAAVSRRFDSPLLQALAATTCGVQASGCAIAAISIKDVLRDYSPFLALGVVIVLITSLMVYQLVTRALERRGLPGGRIKAALRSGQGFFCLYQPIVELGSARPIGCEVLTRFEDAFGQLPPSAFIPAIEKLGRTWDFTERVFAEALPALAPVVAMDPAFKVSVNFYSQDLHNECSERLGRSKPLLFAIEQNFRMNCEILESGLADVAHISRTLARLRTMNFTISVDDFGTGTSNLKQLRGLNADFIKIDKSFVSGVGIEDASIRSSLIPHILEIAREVGVEVIAEGVETFVQAQVLMELGIRYAQGFFFARPVGIAELTGFVEVGRTPIGGKA